MPQYKLIYMNYLGRAEPIRLIFAQAGVEYEDAHITFAEFGDLRKNTLLHQFPLLEVDGKQLCQSHAIERFLGTRYGMAGKDDFESALCDMYIDGLIDAKANLNDCMKQFDPEKRKEKWEKMRDGFQPLLKSFDKVLAASESGFFVGNSVTWADLSIFHWFQLFENLDSSFLDGYPNIQKFQQKISNLPNIKKRIETRKQAFTVDPSDVLEALKQAKIDPQTD